MDFNHNSGEVGLSAIVFYSLSFLILLSIPITVVLIQNQQSRVIKATDNQDFAYPPSVHMSVNATNVKPLENIAISVSSDKSNWHTIYFSELNPGSNKEAVLQKLQSRESAKSDVLYEGSIGQSFAFQPSKSGYLYAISYQLEDYLGEFSTADVACLWDGVLYIFERDQTSLLTELFQNKYVNIGEQTKKKGEWKRFTTCENSGVIEITTSQ